MSKYIAAIPLSSIRGMELYLNAGRKPLTRIKEETGADYILNGGFFNPDWTACPLLKAEGRMLSAAPWREWGFGWDRPEDISLRTDYEGTGNFISCVCLLRGGAPVSLDGLDSALNGARQRSAMGIAGNKLLLYCTNEGTTPKQLQRELAQLGCTDAIMLDGGGSSQCDFAGKKLTSSRVVHNLLLVYTGGQAPQKEVKPKVDKTIVCLDPGHGQDTVNGSPDGSYKEKEFAWDMYRRVRALLEAQGITVVGTRTENETPSLTARANTSNQAGADLFVSLHSNAAGNGGWYDARGFLVYTSAPGGARNQAAAAIINRAHAANIVLHGSGLAHELWTVLAKTVAPAVLIEYGFHTNAEDVLLLKDAAYRDKLAQVTARGVCDFLGMTWAEDDKDDGLLDRADSWAAEAWQKAADKGVLDGTRPRDNLTRQELAVVLERIGII